MVHINVISRSVQDRKGYHRNFSTNEHRFRRAREYVRAVRAAKLERLHAKPFVAAYDGHVETVCKITKVRNKLPIIVSADWDGEIRCWDISQHLLNWRVHGHKGRVMGLAHAVNTSSDGQRDIILSTGIDKTIKIWNLNLKGTARKIWERDANDLINGNGQYNEGDQLPINTIHYHEPFHCIDSCWEKNSNLYATGGSSVCLWDINRNHELHKFEQNNDQCVCLNFNPGQYNILAAGMQDRKIVFYDTRMKSPMPYITLLNWSNEIQFNPIDPRIFVIASNDWNLYTFDLRYYNKALRTHRGHIDAVMTVDWSANGEEFVSGSIDGHIRIWKSTHSNADANETGYSRELYKGKRMYNLYQTRWTWDNKYIVSGSADGAVRLWKAQRSLPLHKINARQQAHINYCERLKEKYQHMPEIGLIWKFRQARVTHRIPRNGIFFKKNQMQRKNLKQLKNKVQNKGHRKWQKPKQNKTWSKGVVQNKGIVHENYQ